MNILCGGSKEGGSRGDGGLKLHVLTPIELSQNGGYVQPPPIKRQFRDPHADWWDKIERRNFGESYHEDADILGMFSTYEYTWVSPRKGFFQFGVYIATFLSVIYGVSLVYPDVPAVPREFEAGLMRELGGPGAVRVSASSSMPRRYAMNVQNGLLANKRDRRECRAILNPFSQRSRGRVLLIKHGTTRLIDRHGPIRQIRFFLLPADALL